jgi:hypothetical protein
LPLQLGENVEVSDIDLDDATFTATGGEPGEDLQVELLMRVVADIGLVVGRCMIRPVFVSTE